MCQKKFEDLELRDDFMFGKVMRNKAICSRRAMKRIFANCLSGAVTIKA